MKSKTEYYGGRKPYDIGIRIEGGTEKKILVKTNLYGEIEKETYGVEEGFLWSDVRVVRLQRRKEISSKDLLILIS